MQIVTIGFTRTSARDFFTCLARAGVRQVIDVRLRNTSSLAGWARKDDLAYFLDAVAGIGYRHEPELLAPTAELLDRFGRRQRDWPEYERGFNDLLRTRRVAERLDPQVLEHACLLCSEKEPHFCHRRLVAEHLSARRTIPLAIVHL